MRVLILPLGLALAIGLPTVAAGSTSKSAVASQRALVQVVRTYDLDGNRQLDANELAELNRVYSAAPDGLLAALDGDGDGTITQSEIPALKPAASAAGGPRSFDKDRNGAIEGVEAEALQKAFAAATKGPLRALDRNRDGQLEDAEIAALNQRLAKPADKRARTRAGAGAAPAASAAPQEPPALELGTGIARLSWQPPTQNADGTPLKNLSGYVIRYGRSPKALDRRIQVDDPKATAFTVEKLPEGTWYFTVSAIAGTGAESMPGPVVSKKITGADGGGR